MRSIPDRLLKQTVTWRARASVDDHGMPTYGSAVSLTRCMDARGDLDAVTIEGEVVVPSGRFIDGEAHAIGVLDQVTLPDGEVARVLQVHRPAGPSTTAHHVTVVYG